MRFWLVLLCLSMLASSPLCALPWAHRARGASVFVQRGCQHCHSVRKVGGHKAPDLSSVGRQMNRNQLRAQILDGGNAMPPFADVLPASEVNDLVAYLRACRDPATKP